MSSSRIPSPARSLGLISTPRKHTPRRSRSVCSARSNMSAHLTAIISDSYKLSPMPNRQSVLNDDTDIEMLERKSWWKKLGDNSTNVIEVLEDKDIAVVNNIVDEFDVEILSQEKTNYTMDLPESSDGESINSIVMPQRKLFTQKQNQAQNKFECLIDKRDTLAKLQKSHFDQEKHIEVGRKNLFSQAKPRSKPAFPAALLNISSKTGNKTKEIPPTEVKGQVRNLFGNRPGTKRKNMFADFIVSDSEDEIPDIQAKVFGFQKNLEQKPRDSSASHGKGHSPTSSIDLEMDDWKLLPSSTMVENQLEADAATPKKKARLSKLSEAKESESTNINSTANKTKQSNKSFNSKNKSKNSKENNEHSNLVSKPKGNLVDDKRNQSLNNSDSIRITRNKSRTFRENSLIKENNPKHKNDSKNILLSKPSTEMQILDKENDIKLKQGEKNDAQNESTQEVPGGDEENFTLEYENDDEHVNESTLIANSEKENKSQFNESNRNASSKAITTCQIKNISNENNDLVVAAIETVSDDTRTTEKAGKDLNKEHDTESEQGGKLDQLEKQNNHNQSLVKDCNKIENSRDCIDAVIRQCQDSVKCQMKESINVLANSHQQVNVDINEEIKGTTRNETSHSNDLHKVSINEYNQQNKNEGANKEKNNESECTSIVQDTQNENIERASLDAEQSEYSKQTHVTNQATEVPSVRGEHEGQKKSHDAHEDEQISVCNEEQSDHDVEDECGDEEKTDREDEEENEIENDDQEQTDYHDSESDEQEQTDENKSDNNASIYKDKNDLESSESEAEEELLESNQEEDMDEIEQNEGDLDDTIHKYQAQDAVEDSQVSDEVVDTTGRRQIIDIKNVKSPETILLHDKTKQIDSFSAQGRNTSVRRTKSMIKTLNIRQSVVCSVVVTDSTVMSDGTRDSSAEGSGWDSHRTTRKTIRMTLGQNLTQRKSLRALVMEQSAKRNTNFNEAVAEATKIPQANSTELPTMDSYAEQEPMHVDETVDEPSELEVSARTRQTTLEMYLQKIKQENIEKKRKLEERIRASLKAPSRDAFNLFKIPLKPVKQIKAIQNKPKKKQIKSSVIPLDMLPAEVLEDMKYKPPKRFRPSNAAWITKRLYKFLESKLEPKYDYKARVRAERLVESIYNFTREVRRGASEQAVDTLKKEMARLDIVRTHFDFYEFFHEFMPREIRIKVVPDIVNNISLPRKGVFSDIIQ